MDKIRNRKEVWPTTQLRKRDEKKTGDKGTCLPMFTTALFTIAKLWKQPRCLTTDKWIKKMWYFYTMEFYSATKKNEILSFPSKQMEL
jgi:hypothetical protein